THPERSHAHGHPQIPSSNSLARLYQNRKPPLLEFVRVAIGTLQGNSRPPHAIGYVPPDRNLDGPAPRMQPTFRARNGHASGPCKWLRVRQYSHGTDSPCSHTCLTQTVP